MFRKTILVSLLASSALTLALATPAAAGVTERAREAIAAAEAKIRTAEQLGAGPNLGEAHALLATAHHDYDTDRRDRAIEDAMHAQSMADTAIGIAQQRHSDAVASARANERATAEAARDQVAAARDQAARTAAEAQGQVNSAQQQAADANARADAAREAAARSAADADAARNAAASAIAQAQTPPPAPVVETTVTTKHAATHHTTSHAAVVHHTAPVVHAAPNGATTSDDVTTTTTKVVPQ